MSPATDDTPRDERAGPATFARTGKAGNEKPPAPQRVDYSAELKLSRNPYLRVLFMGLGVVSLGLGLIGVVVPGLPTVVWMLVATFFFTRSSPPLYNAVMNHRIFGPLVRDYRAGRGMPRRAKMTAVTMIAIFGGSSAAFLIDPTCVRLLVAGLGAFGIFYILRMPTSHG